MKGTHALILSAVLLAGCAAKPQLTRDEWLAVTTRYYPDTTVDQALATAEKVLRLADGDDFEIMHQPQALYGVRKWSVYLVLAADFGTDYWNVQAIPENGGVRMTLQVTRQKAAIVPLSTTDGAFTAGALPGAGTPAKGTVTYALFWDRLSYLLGETVDWVDCGAVKARYIETGQAWGSDDYLCSTLTINDKHPDPAVQALREPKPNPTQAFLRK